MFKGSYSKEGVSFYFLDNSGDQIPISNWEELQSEFLPQLLILSELHDNGLAKYSDNICFVENLCILQLSDIDRQILELPSTYPYEIFIESEGTLTNNSFKFKYGFYDFCPNGTRLEVQVIGAVIILNENEYLLTESQYQVCSSIDAFNNQDNAEKGNVINLKKLSEIKSLSTAGGLTLEQFLDNQFLYIPDKIKLDLDFYNGTLAIIPTVEIENAVGFTNTFDKFPIVRDVYPISNDNGETTRVVISEDQKIELQKIKKQRNISDAEVIKKIVAHPELFFDEEQIDFTVFYSERVKEIGIYSPKFYPFASPYKSEWIPGIVIKTKLMEKNEFTSKLLKG